MTYIQPNDLRNWWEWVRPGLIKIKTKSSEAWIPEDVYADCYSQRSALWVLFSNDKPVGFVVLQPSGEALHVWCGFAYEGNWMETAWEHIKGICRVQGFKRVTFDSNRRGWDKVAGKMGFKPRRWVAEIEKE